MNKIKTVLMDVDGTMTEYYSIRKMADENPLTHLENLMIKKYGISKEEAFRRISVCGDMEIQCISDFLSQLEIDPQDYFDVMAADFKKYIYVPDDVHRFFQYLKEKEIALYTATTNSPFCTRVKLSVSGLADLNDCPYLTGYCPGCMFKDPMGKYSPTYYPKILEHCGFDPETVMMIGDEPIRDMLPAMKAGIRYGVNIDRTQKEACIRKDGGLYINSYDVLIKMIEEDSL